MKIVARADGGGAIGLGHVGRALAIAERIGAHTASRPILITRTDPIVDAFVSGRAVETHAVTGHGYEIDAVLSRVDSRSVLVSDSYDLTLVELTRIHATGCRHLVIDDFARLEAWPCDLVVNPNLGISAGSYDGADALVGPRYALLRDEILRIGGPRVLRGKLDRLLVCLGGGDWGRAGTRLLEAAGASGLHVRATTDGATPSTVEAVDPSTLPDQLRWADAGIVSGGTVKYEAAFAGLPAVVVAVVDHQRDVARLHADHGVAEYAGPLTEATSEGVVAASIRLLADRPKLRRLSLAGQKMIDGCGAERAARRLLGIDGD